MNRRRLIIYSLFFICGVMFFSIGYPVYSHGKEVNISISSLFPDSSQPLTRLYRVVVTFDDGDPVEDAVIEMRAVRQEGGQTIDGIVFHALGEPGLYATEVTYERFGNWDITVIVSEPGEGEATFTDAIVPGASASGEEQTTTASIPTDLSVFFTFNVRDFVNIVFRFVHSLAGVAWFGLIAVVLVAHRFMEPEAEYRTLLRLKTIFWPAAVASLSILLSSGIYNAIWDAPIRAPGVFNLDTMLSIPFGDVYLAAFAGKVIAYGLLVVSTIRLGRSLSTIPETIPENPIDEIQPVTRTAFIAAGIGALLAINIAVLIYMHYISHLSIVIPQ
ncbi:MAG: hypothetical protein D6737_00995 [Chloroflexi bacterium]|nr:MAG: hypothetical protein CUN54_00780 [Phototrophicales bacterium]RMF82710.1 MAG: hypothetical protein D6737_00995 [Chloroflexota bacterium]